MSKPAFSVAVIHSPKIVFLDEPTGGVDPVTRRQFWDLIYKAADDGISVLVTTHYMDEAELCQRVGFISQGKLIALDTPDQLKQSQMRGHVLEINTDNADRAMRLVARRRLVYAASHGSGVRAGDQVILEGEVIRMRSKMGSLRGRALVDGKIACEGEMTFALGDRPGTA